MYRKWFSSIAILAAAIAAVASTVQAYVSWSTRNSIYRAMVLEQQVDISVDLLTHFYNVFQETERVINALRENYDALRETYAKLALAYEKPSDNVGRIEEFSKTIEKNSIDVNEGESSIAPIVGIDEQNTVNVPTSALDQATDIMREVSLGNLIQSAAEFGETVTRFSMLFPDEITGRVSEFSEDMLEVHGKINLHIEKVNKFHHMLRDGDETNGVQWEKKGEMMKELQQDLENLSKEIGSAKSNFRHLKSDLTRYMLTRGLQN